MKKKRCCKDVLNKNNLSFPKFVVGNLPLSMLLLKEEKQPCFNGKVEDPRQKPSGMTTNFNGFTLIELLVVVLIIGILAAVAVPQYQKAVEKARAIEAIGFIRRLRDAQRLYFLANGTFAQTWDELGVEPFSGNHRDPIVFKDFNYWFVTNTEGRVQTNHIKGTEYWIQAYAGSDDRIVCVAVPGVTKSNNLCKSFNPQREDCIGEPGYNCYRIK